MVLNIADHSEMAPIPGNNREEPEKVENDDRNISSLDAPQLIIQAGSSDSEEEANDSAYAGYQVCCFLCLEKVNIKL